MSVIAATAGVRFTLTATSASTLAMLEDGVPLSGTVNKGAYENYKVFFFYIFLSLTRPISPICQSPFFPDLTLKFLFFEVLHLGR